MFETEEQRTNREKKMLAAALDKGWQSTLIPSIFQAPSGSFHDLSAADLTQLDRIEKEGLFWVNWAEELDPIAWA